MRGGSAAPPAMLNKCPESFRGLILTSSSPRDESVSPRRPDKGLLDPPSYNATNRQFSFPAPISSQATLAGDPRFGRVTQPGFKNKTPLRRSFRGTCVCPCKTTSASFSESVRGSAGICCKRNFKPFRTRSITSGQWKLLSQFPLTTVTGGPIAHNSSRILSAQTSPRCQISSAPAARSRTANGNLLCVSAITKIFRVSGLMECWRAGVMTNQYSVLLYRSITPLLHRSTTPVPRTEHTDCFQPLVF
jgi:hypothetical protein